MSTDIANLQIRIDATDARLAQMELNRLHGAGSTTATVMRGLTGAFAGLGLANVAREILQTNREMESLRARLKSVTGSSEEANRSFNNIVQFAKQTPFEIKGLTQAFITLQNFGIKPTNQVLDALTNTASKSGASAENLQGIAVALGQAWGKGKLQGQEIMQLINQSVPIYDALAKATGKNSEELATMAEKGELNREVITKTIAALGEMSSGANANAMETLNGKISNLSDTWTTFQDNLLNSEKENLIGKMVENWAGWIDYFNDKVREIPLKERLDDALKSTILELNELKSRTDDLSEAEQTRYSILQAHLSILQNSREALKQSDDEELAKTKQKEEAQAALTDRLKEQSAAQALLTEQTKEADKLLGDYQGKEAESYAVRTQSLESMYAQGILSTQQYQAETQQITATHNATLEQQEMLHQQVMDEIKGYERDLSGLNSLLEYQIITQSEYNARSEALAQAHAERLASLKLEAQGKEKTGLQNHIEELLSKEKEGYFKQLEAVRVGLDAKLIEQQDYTKQVAEIEKQHNDQVKAIREGAAQSYINSLLGVKDTAASVAGSIASSMGGAAGSMASSFKTASSEARTNLTDLRNAITGVREALNYGGDGDNWAGDPNYQPTVGQAQVYNQGGAYYNQDGSYYTGRYDRYGNPRDTTVKYYHSGGVVGIDEQATVLQNGENVLTAAQAATLAPLSEIVKAFHMAQPTANDYNAAGVSDFLAEYARINAKHVENYEIASIRLIESLGVTGQAFIDKLGAVKLSTGSGTAAAIDGTYTGIAESAVKTSEIQIDAVENYEETANDKLNKIKQFAIDNNIKIDRSTSELWVSASTGLIEYTGIANVELKKLVDNYNGFVQTQIAGISRVTSARLAAEAQVFAQQKAIRAWQTTQQQNMLKGGFAGQPNPYSTVQFSQDWGGGFGSSDISFNSPRFAPYSGIASGGTSSSGSSSGGAYYSGDGSSGVYSSGGDYDYTTRPYIYTETLPSKDPYADYVHSGNYYDYSGPSPSSGNYDFTTRPKVWQQEDTGYMQSMTPEQYAAEMARRKANQDAWDAQIKADVAEVSNNIPEWMKNGFVPSLTNPKDLADYGKMLEIERQKLMTPEPAPNGGHGWWDAKYHTGGIVGEEDITALKGEGVFTRGQMAALAPVEKAGNNIIINVHEAPGTTTEIKQSQQQDGSMQIDVIARAVSGKLSSEIANNTGIGKVIGSTYGLRRGRGNV